MDHHRVRLRGLREIRIEGYRADGRVPELAIGEPQAGVPEYMGSRALRDHVASETSWTVERYLAAGLIICGRSNTAEFGNHCATEPALSGPTLNPWNQGVSPGGSSHAPQGEAYRFSAYASSFRLRLSTNPACRCSRM